MARLAATAVVVFVASVSVATGASAPSVRECLKAWNLSRNAHAQRVLRQGREREAYVEVATLSNSPTHVYAYQCQFVATGGTSALVFAGTWKNGKVGRWSSHTWPPQLPLPTAARVNAHVLSNGKLKAA